MITLRLLGRFGIKLNGTDVEWSSTLNDAQTLLAMIALGNGGLSHASAFASLWPSHSEHHAVAALAEALRLLRRTRPEIADHVIQTQAGLAWSADASLSHDVFGFSQAVLDHDWSRAVAFYTGDFLEGNNTSWAAARRTGLRLDYTYALDRLVAACEARRDYAQARLFANRLLELEPDRESAYECVMHLCTLLSDATGAAEVHRRRQYWLRSTSASVLEPQGKQEFIPGIGERI